MATPQVYAGWRTLIRVNTQLFAAGFVLDYTIDTAADELQGVDNIYPDELAPSRISVGMTLRVYRTPDNDPVALQFAPGGDIADSGGSVAAQESFTGSKYMTIECRDRVTDKTIIYLPKAWLVRRQGSVSSEDLLTENWTIRGIGFYGPGGGGSSLLGAFTSFF